MFNHYLSTALRHFSRHKATTTINVVSLSLGVSCFAVAFGFVTYYENADRYHEKASRTYVLTQQNEVGNLPVAFGAVPISGRAIGPHLRADFPELEIVARATRGEEVAVASENAKQFTEVSYADPEFLEVFDLPLTAGDKRSALRAPHSAVVSEALAKQLFGNIDPLGKALLLNGRETVYVAGVIADPREPSHISLKAATPILRFSLLVSMDTFEAMHAASKPSADSVYKYLHVNVFTYVVFREGSTLSLNQVRNDLKRFSERHIPPDVGRVILDLRPASQVYQTLGDAMMYRDKVGVSNKAWMLLFGSLVLIASCLTYANLASAQAATRLKELAMRRVVGASNRQILAQEFCEALVLLVIAGVLAALMLPGMIGALRTRMGVDLGAAILNSSSFWFGMLAMLLAVALLACSYPAWITTRIRPGHALQSGRAPLAKRRFMYFLVVIQFVSASFLFIITLVMNAQNEKMVPPRAAATDSVVVINNNLKDARVDLETLRNEILKQTAVKSAGAINVAPGQLEKGTRAIVMGSAEPSSKHWLILAPRIDDKFFATMAIPMLAGRELSRDNPADLISDQGTGNVVIDRALALEYGWKDPQEAIGKHVYVPNGGAKGAVGLPRTVVGVSENTMLTPGVFFGSTATLYSLNPDRASVLLVRLAANDMAAGIRAIDAVWNRIAPNIPLKRSFMDEQFDAAHKQITLMMSMFPLLAIFAAFVGTLGLAGIATHAMAQRKFEIGVRRTLGASVRGVVAMLLKDFSKPIIVANLIAWPAAYGLSKLYTSFFAEKVPVTVAPFAASLLLGLIIAWLAVLRQARDTARMNPATVLRHE